jgi:hypothetical protein
MSRASPTELLLIALPVLKKSFYLNSELKKYSKFLTGPFRVVVKVSLNFVSEIAVCDVASVCFIKTFCFA